MEHVDDILARHVAGSAWSKRAAAKAAKGRIDHRCASFHGCPDIGDPGAAGVVEVHPDRQRGNRLDHPPDKPRDVGGISHAYGVSKGNLDRFGFGQRGGHGDDAVFRNLAIERAAERCADRGLPLQARFLRHSDNSLCGDDRFVACLALVGNREAIGRNADGAEFVQAARGDGALGTFGVEDEADEADVSRLGKASADLFGVGHLRHALGIDETCHLEAPHAGIEQALDERELGLGVEQLRLCLQAVTRPEGREFADRVISRLKVLADLDISERRIPQDGRLKLRHAARSIDVRVSIMPSLYGEDAVLRILDRYQIAADERLSLAHLSFGERESAFVRQMAKLPYGLFLVTGPTGSGKTTTLYAVISEVNSGQEKIITIEDPVEYQLPDVLQIPVNEAKGLTFARGLRSILRHDPDKIMVGEIRDDDTAQIAVQAALTGHLVFTTVHANSVFDVLGRFMHMGVDPYSLSAALNGIVSQRLVRQNCAHCSVDVEPDDALLPLLGLTRADVAGWRLRAGRGCAHCRGVGFKGRHAVAEVLMLDDPLKEMIATKAPVSQLKAHAASLGMKPIRTLVTEMVARGETTLDELMRVVG